jgi:hypothetical protein
MIWSGITNVAMKRQKRSVTVVPKWCRSGKFQGAFSGVIFSGKFFGALFPFSAKVGRKPLPVQGYSAINSTSFSTIFPDANHL